MITITNLEILNSLKKDTVIVVVNNLINELPEWNEVNKLLENYTGNKDVFYLNLDDLTQEQLEPLTQSIHFVPTVFIFKENDKQLTVFKGVVAGEEIKKFL